MAPRCVVMMVMSSAVIVGVLMIVIVFMGVGLILLISLVMAGRLTQVDHPNLPTGNSVLIDVADLDLSVRKMQLIGQVDEVLMSIRQGGQGT